MPPWVRRTLNKELLTPLVKAAPPPGREPDCRPAKGRDMDISGWTKGQQRKHCKEVSRQLIPQQLAIGVPDGVAIKAHGSNLRLELARRTGKKYMQLALDLKNAHNEYDRRAAQQRLVEHETAQPNSTAWMDLSRAHHSDCAQPSDVYMRDATAARGLKHVCEGRAGGPQGSALTCIVFPILLDGILKETEQRFPGVETKAIQDDVDLYGDPAIILGEGGALDFILAEFKKVDLEPNLKKFQAYTISPAEFQAALSAEQKKWLKRTFIITDPILRSQVEHAETLAGEAKAAAADAPPATKAEAKAAAQLLAAAAEAMRATVPEVHRAYGITGCGAAVGDDAYVQDFLLQKERELCGDPESGDVGTIARVTAALAERSAHCAHTAIFYSLQSRVDYVLSVHLPSQTRRLAAAVDEALREAYARALGADILNPEGDFPEQLDPTFTRDRFSLKHSLGGGGYRLTAERIPFLNSLFSALPAISGSAAQAPLWPSLAPIVGGRSVYDKDSKPEEQCWTTFFASGCRMAREMQEEIARTRRLRDEALESAGLAANPPQSAVFDRPDEGLGYRIGKVQKRAFDEIKGLRAKGLERRAGNLPPEDQRRMASVFSANDRFANSFGEGAPLRSTPFSNDEFRVAAQSRFGVPLTCLKPFINQPLKSNASAPDKFVDAFGNNIKKLVGAEGGGTTANHNSFMNVISAWCRRAQIPHRGGTSGTPRTCKGLFSAYTQALHDLDLPEEDIRVLNKIIPDFLFDLQGAGEAFEDMKQMGLSGEQPLGEAKTKAPNSDYHKDEPPVAARQAEVARDYLKRAARIDELNGHPQGSDGQMVTALKRYNGGRVLVFVMGAFAEMSGDVSRICDIIAHDLARTHVSYYNDDAKRTKGMYRKRIQKAWGHTAHRGWARLLLDRARDLIIHGPAHRGANGAAMPTDEDDQDGHFFYNHPERGVYFAA